MPLSLTTVPTELSARTRRRFRARVSGDPTGAPTWVRAIATVGEGPGWFEPDGVVWRVHGDVSTLVGGVGALMGQAAHPLALAGVAGHSDYRVDPWARLAGTARWLVTTTFGSAQLAEREALRVRTMHTRVSGSDDRGRAYAASDPALLRWVHLAFTDAFLAAQQAVGTDLAPRFGSGWADVYVREWSRSARALGADDLPETQGELADALAAYAPVLEPVPEHMRTFLSAPPDLRGVERVFYRGLASGAAHIVSPTVASLAGAPGRPPIEQTGGRHRGALVLRRTRLQLIVLERALGPYSPSEQAARWRLGMGPKPEFMPG